MGNNDNRKLSDLFNAKIFFSLLLYCQSSSFVPRRPEIGHHLSTFFYGLPLSSVPPSHPRNSTSLEKTFANISLICWADRMAGRQTGAVAGVRIQRHLQFYDCLLPPKWRCLRLPLSVFWWGGSRIMSRVLRLLGHTGRHRHTTIDHFIWSVKTHNPLHFYYISPSYFFFLFQKRRRLTFSVNCPTPRRRYPSIIVQIHIPKIIVSIFI